MSFRQRAKRLLEQLLVGVRLPSAGRLWHRRRTVVLAYHNIVPDGEAVGDRSLHLSRDAFSRQLDRLQRTHDVIGMDRLLEGPGREGRPRAIVTFDDAYRGTLAFGLPELTRRGMPATVFVAPGLLGDQCFWWDLMADPVTGEVSPAMRDRALTSMGGRHHRILAEARVDPERSKSMPFHSRSATEDELRAAVAEHEVLLGSHTWSHPNLAELPDEEISEEVGRSWRWLTERFSATVPWLAYPYGLTSERVARLAARELEGALSLTGRLAPHPLEGAARYGVPRINVPSGISVDGFELRISGVVRR